MLIAPLISHLAIHLYTAVPQFLTDAPALLLKLVIHKNFVNHHNLYNQVGIVAINIVGDTESQVSAATNKVVGGAVSNGAVGFTDRLPSSATDAMDDLVKVRLHYLLNGTHFNFTWQLPLAWMTALLAQVSRCALRCRHLGRG